VELQVQEVPVKYGSSEMKLFCDFKGIPPDLLKWYRRLLVSTQYFAPLLIISAMYSLLAYRLWGAQPPGNAQNQRDATLLRNKKRVSRNENVFAISAFIFLRRAARHKSQSIITARQSS
jgi:hypothetical protein